MALSLRRCWIEVAIRDGADLGKTRLTELTKTVLVEFAPFVQVSTRNGKPVLKLEAWDDASYRELEARVALRLSTSGYAPHIERNVRALRARG